MVFRVWCINSIDQFRWIKIQPNTIDFRTTFWAINPTNSVVILQNLVLRSIVLCWIIFPLFNHVYYMASSASGQDEPNRDRWLATERARWSHLARSGLPAVSCKQNFTKSHIINPLLTKFFGQDGWILASFFFCEFMDLDFVSVHKHAKKELGQYPDILTSHSVNYPYV